MRIGLVCLLLLSLSSPVFAQQSEERRNMEQKATFFLWTGISVAAAGITPLIYGVSSLGVPLVAGGGGLIYYAFRVNNQAKQMPSTTLGIVPVRRVCGSGSAVLGRRARTREQDDATSTSRRSPRAPRLRGRILCRRNDAGGRGSGAIQSIRARQERWAVQAVAGHADGPMLYRHDALLRHARSRAVLRASCERA